MLIQQFNYSIINNVMLSVLAFFKNFSSVDSNEMFFYFWQFAKNKAQALQRKDQKDGVISIWEQLLVEQAQDIFLDEVPHVLLFVGKSQQICQKMDHFHFYFVGRVILQSRDFVEDFAANLGGAGQKNIGSLASRGQVLQNPNGVCPEFYLALKEHPL